MNEVITSGVHNQVVKSDQELSIIDVKIFFTIKWSDVEGSIIGSKKSPVAAHVVIDKSAWETQHFVRSLDACVEWVYSTSTEFGRAILLWIMVNVGRVVSRSRSGVSDERTAM